MLISHRSQVWSLKILNLKIVMSKKKADQLRDLLLIMMMWIPLFFKFKGLNIGNCINLLHQLKS